MITFSEAVKSTVDRLAFDLSQEIPEVEELVCLEGQMNLDEILYSDKDTLISTFMYLSENPRDPLYSCTFGIGCKTGKDVGGYRLARNVSRILEKLKKSTVVQVKDYTQELELVENLGTMFIVDAEIEPQEDDKEHGVRFVIFQANCISAY